MRSSSCAIARIALALLCLSLGGNASGGQAAPSTPAPSAQSTEPPAMEAHGMPPRSAPSDYQAQAKAGSVTIGADFLGHSIPRSDGGPLSTEDYVVVEAGLFAPAGQRLQLALSDFALNINGKKAPLSSQSYVPVVRTVKDPEWIAPGELEAKKTSKTSLNGGANDNGPPPPVHIPIEMQRSMAQTVKKAALPEGDRLLPQAGLLFFEFRGKSKAIHSLELLYNGPAGKASLKLQP